MSNTNIVQTEVPVVKKPRAPRKVNPNKSDEPKNKPLLVKYKTMIAAICWFLDAERLSNDSELSDEDLVNVLDVLPTLQSLIPVFKTSSEQTAFFNFNIEHEFKNKVTYVVRDQKKENTKQRKLAENAANKAVKAAERAANPKPRKPRVPKEVTAPTISIIKPNDEVALSELNALMDTEDTKSEMSDLSYIETSDINTIAMEPEAAVPVEVVVPVPVAVVPVPVAVVAVVEPVVVPVKEKESKPKAPRKPRTKAQTSVEYV